MYIHTYTNSNLRTLTKEQVRLLTLQSIKQNKRLRGSWIVSPKVYHPIHLYLITYLFIPRKLNKELLSETLNKCTVSESLSG